MKKQNLLILLSKQNSLKYYKSIQKTPCEKRIYNIKINRINIDKLNINTLSLDKKTSFTTLPKKVDLRSKFQPVFDQGNIGSCTANAFCGLVGYLQPLMIGSRLFLYYNIRDTDVNTTIDTDTDSGAYLSDGIISLQKHGICQELDWPYILEKFDDKPNDDCYKYASKHTITQVENINNDIFQMKNNLANGNPFVVGIAIYSSFESVKTKKTGMIPMPTVKDIFLGGHAVVCVGFDDSKKVWIMRNSWGSNWGDKGYFYLPYLYLLSPSLSTELWCIKKMTSI
jgi:C1A family cysteine protease